MQRFKSSRYAQCFLPTHGQVHNPFQLRCRLTASGHRAARDAAFQVWRDAVSTDFR